MNLYKKIVANKTKEELFTYLAIVAGFLFVGYAVYAQTNTQEDKKEQQNNTEQVELLDLQSKRQNSAFVKTSGEVEAKNSVELKSEVSAKVRGVYVDLGQRVYRGQTLMAFDSTSAYSRLQQARANLKSAQAQKQQLESALQSQKTKLKKLQNSPRPEEVQQAKTKLESAKDSLKETKQKAQQDLDRTQTSALNTAQLSIDQAKDIILNVTDFQYDYFVENDQESLRISEAKRAAIDQIWNQESAGEWTKRYISSLNGGLDRDVDQGFDDLEVNKTKKLLDRTILGLNKVKVLLNEISIKNEFTVSDESTLRQDKQAVRNQLNALRNQKEAISSQIATNNSSIQQAESSLASARENLNLVNSGAQQEDIDTQKESIEQAKANLKMQEASIDSARADITSAQSDLAKRTITSPITGTVAELEAKPGELVSNGQLVAKVVNTDGYQIKTFLSSENIINIDVNNTTTVADRYKGRVTNISPSINSSNNKVEVIISVNSSDPNLVAGDYVDVKIEKNKNMEETVLLPIESVDLTNQGSFVYLIDENNKVKTHKIEVGNIVGSQIEVKSGLEEIKEIIKSTRGIQAGDKVTTI